MAKTLDETLSQKQKYCNILRNHEYIEDAGNIYYRRIERMFNDIFVGVMIVVALAAGVWCWWFENFEPKKKDDTTKDIEK